eukprot:6201722-Pleurochrysis_carterae.AAC.1
MSITATPPSCGLAMVWIGVPEYVSQITTIDSGPRSAVAIYRLSRDALAFSSSTSGSAQAARVADETGYSVVTCLRNLLLRTAFRVLASEDVVGERPFSGRAGSPRSGNRRSFTLSARLESSLLTRDGQASALQRPPHGLGDNVTVSYLPRTRHDTVRGMDT